MPLIIAFLLVFAPCVMASNIDRYPSGWIRSFESKQETRASSEQEALRGFFDSNYKTLGPDYQWKELSSFADGTHRHLTYQLYYRGREVLDFRLKVHYNWKGFVEYASSTMSSSFSVDIPKVSASHSPSHSSGVITDWENRIKAKWLQAHPQGKVKAKQSIWVHPQTGEAKPVIDALLYSPLQVVPRRLIIEEGTAALLEERQTSRSVSASAKVHKISPFGNRPADTVTLENLTDASSLRNATIHVRREQYDTSTEPAGVTLLDVVPMDFTAVSGFSTDPTQYNYQCEATGGSLGTKCPNQGFDAVNVYYHVENFRRRIDGYLTTLGATATFTYDPLNILINPLSITTTANNALYVGEPCRSDGTMDRCLLFLRPDTLTGSSASRNCAKSSAQFYDLAREAVVLAHEYQHYVTDMITHIGFGTGGTSVGDAIHEGYSDYFAASYVSEHTATAVTKVGEYALQDCAPLQRELATLRPYENSEADRDPHTSGLSWASGLWKLRTELGVSIADLISLKSLFFLSTSPGAAESVEALVRADQAVYGGVHVGRIRTLFYDEVKFVGGQSGVFRDSASGIAEVGFRGCSVSYPMQFVSGPVSPGLNLLSTLLWLISTLGLARFFSKRKSE
jgi:hypothetical protein